MYSTVPFGIEQMTIRHRGDFTNYTVSKDFYSGEDVVTFFFCVCDIHKVLALCIPPQGRKRDSCKKFLSEF